jgi:hypothetical protein
MIYDLSGPEGNAYCVMAFVKNYLRNHGESREDIETVMEDMRSSTYLHMLRVARRTVPGLKFRNLPKG